MADRISRSVNTAWKKRAEPKGGGGEDQTMSPQVGAVDWTLSCSVIEADCGSVCAVRVCLCACPFTSRAGVESIT